MPGVLAPRHDGSYPQSPCGLAARATAPPDWWREGGRPWARTNSCRAAQAIAAAGATVRAQATHRPSTSPVVYRPIAKAVECSRGIRRARVEKPRARVRKFRSRDAKRPTLVLPKFEQIRAWHDSYCKQHPDDLICESSDALVKSLEAH